MVYTIVDPSAIFRVFQKHRITCKHTQDNTVMLGFVIYDSERIPAKYYSDNIVEVQKEFTLHP